jgi:hypothetical protein
MSKAMAGVEQILEARVVDLVLAPFLACHLLSCIASQPHHTNIQHTTAKPAAAWTLQQQPQQQAYVGATTIDYCLVVLVVVGLHIVWLVVVV